MIVRLFELDPSAAEVFHFEKDSPFDDDDFYRSEKLVRHAMMFINMLDRALQLLGPDIAMMSEILNELGQKHCKYGVQPHHFTAMGDALMATLQELLGEKFDNPTRDAWCEIYQAMSYDMISARTNGDLFPVHPGRRQSGDIWVIVD